MTNKKKTYLVECGKLSVKVKAINPFVALIVCINDNVPDKLGQIAEVTRDDGEAFHYDMKKVLHMISAGFTKD